MHLLDLTLPTAAENLALDEALLLAAEGGGPEVLRLWENPSYAVVLGSGGSAYLTRPGRQPDYRRNRPHEEFLTNLPADAATVRRLLVAGWQPEGEYGPPPMDRVRELVAEKYAKEEWNRRR